MPHNKNFYMATPMLKLYRLTGEAIYRERATKIHDRFKAAFTPIDGYHSWNYWEPMAPSDILPNGQPRHWVNTHPYVCYQAMEIPHIVFAYNLGVTYTEADIRQRIQDKLNAGEYCYELKARDRHMSREKADNWIYRNMGRHSAYVYMHEHED